MYFFFCPKNDNNLVYIYIRDTFVCPLHWLLKKWQGQTRALGFVDVESDDDAEMLKMNIRDHFSFLLLWSRVKNLMN